MKVLVGKGRGLNLVPFDPQAEEFIGKLKSGEGAWVEVKKCRNPKFHRKFFALLNLAFEAWEPEEGAKEYRGQAIAKNFDRFREDVTILAGHYEATYNIRGDVRLRAKSIAFGSMDDFEFNDLYRDVFNVCWDMVLKKARYESPEQVEQILNNLLAFE